MVLVDSASCFLHACLAVALLANPNVSFRRGNFKAVNTRYGWLAGDTTLERTSVLYLELKRSCVDYPILYAF